MTASDKGSFVNAAGLVSRACVGREVFSQRIADATVQHLQKIVDEYKKRFNYKPAVWSGVKSKNPFEAFASSHFWNCNFDLAVLANVLCRPILLFDAAPPHLKDVVLPFLRRPDECRDRNGILRTPLVLAWSNDSHRTRVALVSTVKANIISPIRLPRDWFDSISEMKNKTRLTQYVDFDEQNTCLIASGKYFKVNFYF